MLLALCLLHPFSLGACGQTANAIHLQSWALSLGWYTFDESYLPPVQSARRARLPCSCGHRMARQTPYLHFIAELLRTLPGRPLVLLEVRAVSVSLTRRAVTADAVASAAAGILERHGWQSAAFVGHSYGTFVLSRLALTRAALVQSMTLIDPVSMLTIYPQLLHNFVYRTFHPAHGLIDSLRYSFSRDLVIAAVSVHSKRPCCCGVWACSVRAALTVSAFRDKCAVHD